MIGVNFVGHHGANSIVISRKPRCSGNVRSQDAEAGELSGVQSQTREFDSRILRSTKSC